MRYNWFQTCAAAIIVNNAHVLRAMRMCGLQAIQYLNISGLVIDFATSPVRTGNSFFGRKGLIWSILVTPTWSDLFGLAFLLMLIYRELNFNIDCFIAYVTSCSYTN